MAPSLLWVSLAFTVLILALLALDLGVFHRTRHALSLKEALGWSAVWITLALLFNAFLLLWRGATPALEFFTGYLLEKSLSVDNIFVIALIFGFFKTPAEYQHQVLTWGILGALVMRGIMIVGGAALLHEFELILYLFGVFLIFTGLKMATQPENDVHPDGNPVVRLVGRFLPVVPGYEHGRFLTRIGGRLAATPLLLALVVVESTDLAFALDSIPAIFAVTKDPFIVYTSNVFAILGLRALYFVLAGAMHKFHYLKLGLAVVLMFIGLKMLLDEVHEIPIGVSLLVVVVVLAVAVVASLVRARRQAVSTNVPV